MVLIWYIIFFGFLIGMFFIFRKNNTNTKKGKKEDFNPEQETGSENTAEEANDKSARPKREKE